MRQFLLVVLLLIENAPRNPGSDIENAKLERRPSNAVRSLQRG